MKESVAKILQSKYLFLFIVGFNTLFFAIMAMMLPLHYEANDDIVFAMLLNGTYTGESEIGLVWINVIYAFLIHLLYVLMPSIEWYTTVFAVLHIIAFSIITHSIFVENRINTVIKFGSVVFFYCFWTYIILFFQFTTTAAIVTLAGCICLLKQNNNWKITGVILILVGSLIRFHSAAVVGLLFSPLLIGSKDSIQRNWKSIVCTSLLVLCAFVVNKIYCSNPTWSNYFASTCKVLDDPDVGRIFEYYTGDEQKDVALLMCFTIDPKVMDAAFIKRVKDNFYSKDYWSINSIKAHISPLRKYVYFLSIIVGCFLLLGLFNGQNVKLLSFVECAIFFAALIGVSLWTALKERAFLAMLCTIAYILFVLCKGMDKHWLIVLIYSSLLLLSFDLCYSMNKKKIPDVRWEIMEWQNMIAPLIGKCETGYLYSSYLPTELINPWNIRIKGTVLVANGWMARTPYMNGTLDGLDDVVNKKMNIILSDRQDLKHMQEFISRHYGISTTEIRIDSIGTYRLVKLEQLNNNN